MNRSKSKNAVLGIILSIVLFLLYLIGFSAIWCMLTWRHLKMDELVYELSAPLRGTGRGMLIRFFVFCIVPAAAAAFVSAVIFHKTKKKPVRFGTVVIPVIFTVVCTSVFYVRLSVSAYLKNQKSYSRFIEDNYVDASDVRLTFPEKKRNLIYIFLESVETTYSDKEHGGAFSYDCIPELTGLALENECFSANGSLNGGLVYPGTSWTMGGMFAQTSGLPLKLNIGNNMMDQQENFFPTITALGDVLKDAGYNQEFLLGSDVWFGGREAYLSRHGDYTFHDYSWAVENGLLPEGYMVWWGYEDARLFQFARQDLTELASKEEPFNLTMLTVDTHFEDGYVCDLCGNEFGDDQYANVMACSSRQVADFVNWVKEQDFYENTTIVLCGDHTTMDSDFCIDVDPAYPRRTYTAVINAPISKSRTDDNIIYSTMDMFPTTLAALGVKIEGDRLGLGTNLFSEKQTLSEQYGYDHVAQELDRGSQLMNLLSGINANSEENLKREGRLPDGSVNVISYDEKENAVTVKADDIVNVDGLKKVEMTLFDPDDRKLSKTEMTMNDDHSFSGRIVLDGIKDHNGKIVVSAIGDTGEYNIGELKGDLRLSAHDDIRDYVELLKAMDDPAVFIASQGEAEWFAPGEIYSALGSLGVKIPIRRDNAGFSFCAVMDKGKVLTDREHGSSSLEGVLDDNTAYKVSSGPENSSILINGEEYSMKKPGISFAVYDHDLQAVTDTVCFEIPQQKYPQPYGSIDAKVSGKKVSFRLSDLYLRDGRSIGELMSKDVRGELWDADSKDAPLEFDLSLVDGTDFAADIDIGKIDAGDCYLNIYVENTGTFVENKVIKWHGDLRYLKSDPADYLDAAAGSGYLICAAGSVTKENAQELSGSFGSLRINEKDINDNGITCVCASLCGDAHNYITDSAKADLKGTAGGSGYELTCMAEDDKNGYSTYTSMMIDDREYSFNEEGINIAVYDPVTHSVLDRVLIRAASGKVVRPYYLNFTEDTAFFK